MFQADTHRLMSSPIGDFGEPEGSAVLEAPLGSVMIAHSAWWHRQTKNTSSETRTGGDHVQGWGYSRSTAITAPQGEGSGAVRRSGRSNIAAGTKEELLASAGPVMRPLLSHMRCVALDTNPLHHPRSSARLPLTVTCGVLLVAALLGNYTPCYVVPKDDMERQFEALVANTEVIEALDVRDRR
jgi:hypothetical protein